MNKIVDIRLEIFQNHEKSLSETSTTKHSDIWSVAEWWWNDRQGEIRGLGIIYWFLDQENSRQWYPETKKTLLSSLSENECIPYKGRIKIMHKVILYPRVCVCMHECVSAHVWEDRQTHILCVCACAYICVCLPGLDLSKLPRLPNQKALRTCLCPPPQY